MKNNKKGFTLIELLVVVLIIGILAAIALPQYFRAVERSRAAEALTLFGSIAGAEQRRALLTGAYTTSFGELDLDFVGADGQPVTDAGPLLTNNFSIELQGTTMGAGQEHQVVATRRTPNRYGEYTLQRDYESGQVTCTPAGDASICTAIGVAQAAAAAAEPENP